MCCFVKTIHITWKKKKKDSLFERRETKILEGENWIVKVDEGGDPK